MQNLVWRWQDKGLTSFALLQDLPEALLLKGVSATGCLLSTEARWLLSSGLPEKMRQTWQLLFNSNVHGQSFSTFMGRAG